MYTLAIGGRAIAVTNATQDQARELFSSDEFQEDIATLKTNGSPIWDGSAAMEVRAASEDEQAAFDEAMSEDDDDDLAEDEDSAAEDDEDGDDEAGIDVLFLIPIDGMDGPAS